MNNNNVKTVEKLNEVLADLQMVYQNFRAMHWLVKGADFYMLHKLFEEFYTETADTVDEVAERILMLGGVPDHQWESYLKKTKLQAVKEASNGKENVKVALSHYEQMLSSYRALIEIASENNDEGTLALASDLIVSTEKKIWMLSSTLS